MLEADDLQALAEDIKQNGLREPILVFEGQVLDGRNRFLACKQAEVEPQFREFTGSDEAALAWVISVNLRRRHLTFEQRALAAAKISTLSKGQKPNAAVAASAQATNSATQADAAERLDVSRGSVQRARKVVEKGSPELQQAVEAGEVSLAKAAAVTSLPKAEQLKAAQEAKPEPPEQDSDSEPEPGEEEHLASMEREYLASVEKVMTADDKMAAMHEELKRQAAEIALLKTSRDHFQNKCAALTRRVQALQNKCDRLERQSA